MNEYDPARYGEHVGDYDTQYPDSEQSTAAAVQLLYELAASHEDRSLMEMGIGTGRLSLPVQERGIRVAGIDGSPVMIERLRAKPGGADVEVVLGDYRDAVVPGSFGVVALIFNGIFDTRGRPAQLDIFANAARHLAPGGYFVVESWVMNDDQRSGEWSVVPRLVGDDHVELQLARYDLATNQIERTLVHLRPSGTEFLTVRDTYASPGELDLMADISGFDRHARYSSWARAEFTARSQLHVTVYQLRSRC